MKTIMKKQLTILFLLVSAALVCQAQGGRNPQPDSLIKIVPIVRGVYGVYGDYNVPYGYSQAFIYTIGGKPVSSQEVASRLLNYGPSAAEYNAAQRNLNTGYILYGGAAVASIGAVVAYVDGTKSVPITITNQYGNSVTGSTYQHNTTGAVILTGVALGLATAALITILNVPKHRQKSVWLYNLRFQ